MRKFLAAVVLVWTAASIAAYVYSLQQHIPRSLLFALLPAFLAELAFYLMPGFEGLRKRFDKLGSKGFRAVLLTSSAAVPYLIVSLRLGTFRFTSLMLLLTIAGAAAFWYALMRPSIAVDLFFLGFVAGIYLSKAFPEIYPRPMPHLQLEVLGRLMWIRLGVMSVLSLRRIENVRFGFLPSSAEWRIGIEQFLYFMPVGVAAMYLLKFAHFRPLPLVWWQFAILVPVMFAGILWVLALGEEFFFRGFLQQLVSRGLRSRAAGLVIGSVVFGAAHLWYRSFPNWRFALIAGIAGVFYGISFLRAGSIRASMVTHALIVTTWRSLFSG